MKVQARTPKPDAVDGEHLAQTLATRGWELMAERIERMLETARKDLEFPDASTDALRFLQGKTAALRAVLEIPRHLAAEIAERERRR